MPLELEHVATSDRRTLAAWGFSEHRRTTVNWGIEQLALTLDSNTAGTDAPIWAYRDKVELWDGAVRIGHYWVTVTGNTADAAREAQPYILSGPGWWLDNTPYNDSSDTGYLDQSAPINGQLAYLLAWAISAGAPIAAGTLALAGLSPALGAGQTVLSAMQQVARYSPLSYGGWVHSGAVPAFDAALRANLTPVSLALFGGRVAAWDIRPRPDMQVHRVHIIYTAPNPTPGSDPIPHHDIAGDPDWPRGPGYIELTIPCESTSAAVDAVGGVFGGIGYGSIAQHLFAALSPLCYEGTVQLAGALEDFPHIRPGMALNLTGGPIAWATMAAVVQQVEYASAPAGDSCTITLGLPQHLAAQDYLELYRLASGAAEGTGNPYPPTPPPPTTPTPGTVGDLNGGTDGQTPTGTLEYQTRGGLCTMKGFAPFTGQPAAPAVSLYYRVKTWTGTCSAFVGPDCASLELQTTNTLSGACTYSAATGALTSTSNYESTGPSPVQPAVGSIVCTEGVEGMVFFHPYGQDGANTSTQLSRVPKSCAESGGGSAGTGTITCTLSSLDTEESAFARMLAANTLGDDGDGWVSGSNTAIFYPRESNSFVWRELRYRAPSLSGAKGWWTYTLSVQLERRSVATSGSPTGDWEDAEIRTHNVQADVAGNASLGWQIVQPARGYESRVKSYSIAGS